MQTEPTEFNGTPCLRLHADGATALVALHGAHVLSWIPADGRERLFLSERANYGEGASIRGGVPVIFPQFGERGPHGRHGFARSQPWQFDGIADGRAVFALHANARTAHWPHAFTARLCIALSASRLELTLDVDNPDTTDFAFTAALHTYLRVHDLADVALEGLQGCDYEDSAAGGVLRREHNFDVRFDGEVDRIYNDVVAPLTLRDGAHTTAIEQDGFSDTVVWNPGATLAATLRDLAPVDHQRFVCVEAGQVLQPVVLAPGERWSGTQRLG
ncbi:D-hexose-6-phosphate mutarotase [Lysobacter solisilvae (ex Woo and Kim 2020)]|uniref:Putative glucose-6-phosphate 1-epimerase n=1 Tax=Agrilutibacter terrestris TaxID=2865112 RepID=A0A7H0FUG4_9GAMM|nr:D-hexose-6-phosphate mutarotase [Lysobacter terrestris]QNP39680.1 D-hexose-6-phosphate mutarotase [Lysobacter terrestris]